ncbi:MAG: MotA/TolQ/ExbB proton channel family protein [Helicobacteraceae bacterium]
MKPIIALFLAMIFLHANELDKLLLQTKNELKKQESVNKEREANFLQEYKQNQNALKALKERLAIVRARSKELEKTLNQNYKLIDEKQEQLRNANGDLQDLFSIAKQNAGEFLASVQNRFSIMQDTNKTVFLKNISAERTNLKIDDIKNLWLAILNEIMLSSKMSVYKEDVFFGAGKTSAEVVAIANFNAFSNGLFLKIQNDKLIEANQPYKRYNKIVSDFLSSKDEIANLVIDPSRGSILDLLSRKPTMKERMIQGGIVGGIIILIGLIGLVFSFYKFFTLYVQVKKIKAQEQNLSAPTSDNALGRFILDLKSSSAKSLENAELKLDEILDKETDKLQSGMGMLKVFIATAPLLGLLGTVTGMILTFQTITLFGTSDPKLMANGISQALITTMLGLSTAIPLLFIKAFLDKTIKKVTSTVEQNALGLLAKEKFD